MLTKEYRICLPMSVEEYRIAQLYMIQKKSRDESSGQGSGVEILINEPYKDGPGGNGQYTHKIYHIGSHLPGWFRSILPKSALRVEEEAWNAYPYTRTIYRCPFIEKFLLEIETVYQNDGGEQDNVFNLGSSELRNRVTDYLDIVKDPIAGGDYKKDEDPKLFCSTKTGRGPLGDNWHEEYTAANKDSESGRKIMCAYKLCKVEFKYWGMQSKIERFIHDVGLRKTMLRAHRQAWAWQDEYFGLTMTDIRRLEEETQRALQEKYGMPDDASDTQVTPTSAAGSDRVSLQPPGEAGSTLEPPVPMRESENALNISGHMRVSTTCSVSSIGSARRQSWCGARSRASGAPGATEWPIGSIEKLRNDSSDEDEEFYDAQEDLYGSCTSKLLYRSSSMEEVMTPEDEYVDPPTDQLDYNKDELVGSSLDRRMEQCRNLQQGVAHSIDFSAPNTPPLPSIHNCKTTLLFLIIHGGSIMDAGQEYQLTKHSDLVTLRSTMDTVVKAHYPTMHHHIATRLVPCPHVSTQTLNLLASLNPYSFDAQTPNVESSVVGTDNFPLSAIPLFVTGSPAYFDAVVQLVNKTNLVYNEFLRSEEGAGFSGQVCLIADSMGSVLAYDALCKNNPFLQSRHESRRESQSSAPDEHCEMGDNKVHPDSTLEPGKQVSHSNPDLTVTADDSVYVTEVGMENGMVGGNMPASSQQQKQQLQQQQQQHAASHKQFQRHVSCPTSRRTSTGSQGDVGKFDFDVSDFFMFGSPLGLVLAYRRMSQAEDRSIPSMQFLDPLAAAIGHEFYSLQQKQNDDLIPRPSCHQIYNIFYPSDPSAIRLEPALQERFRHILPHKVPRYQKFPLGDGQPVHVVETLQKHTSIFTDAGSAPSSSHSHEAPSLERRHSNMSISSQASGYGDFNTVNITAVTARWWGNKRLDYVLYNPDALQSFPNTALPYLLHASFWESTDVVAFILRQVVRQELLMSQGDLARGTALFKPTAPREKWLKRRTTIKLRNVAPNHRANDVIMLEDRPQQVAARFMYGPLDMVSLSGEKVDVHVMTQPPSGEWVYFSTEVTDSTGRAVSNIVKEKRLPQGMYPVKMVVRGDHTCVDFYLTVLPPRTETVVFSIDGSFTASVSIMGKDPKVRPGAVDVVRHWQDLGYLIVYISARPDMQQKKVVAWLAQHNFPHGMVAFMDGLSADPLRQKGNYLKTLIQEAQILICGAYGSVKDISVYQAISGLAAQNIYIVGKVNKKQSKECMAITDGYATHLNQLATMSRPATGNARMFLRKSCFSLPGQSKYYGKKPVKKTMSLPQRAASLREASSGAMSIGISESGNTVVDAGPGKAGRARGVSPRGKMAAVRYDSNNA